MGKAPGRHGLRMLPSVDPVYSVAKGVFWPWLRWGLRWTIEGADHIPTSGPVILASNHVSYLDPLTLAWVADQRGRHVRYLAKAELFDKPVLGTLLRAAHQIPVRRGRAEAADALTAAVDALARGECIGVFPEGTISEDLEPMLAKSGTARLAHPAGVAITPVGLWGTHRILTKGRKPHWQWRIPQTAVVGEPIVIGPDEHVKQTTERMMTGIIECVARAREIYPVAPNRVRRRGGGAIPAPPTAPENRVTRVAVIGAGSWGTAVAAIVAGNEPTTLWARRPELADRASTPTTRTPITCPASRCRPRCTQPSDLEEACRVGRCGRVRRSVARTARAFSPTPGRTSRADAAIVSLAKGIEQGTLRRMTEVIAEELRRPRSGPYRRAHRAEPRARRSRPASRPHRSSRCPTRRWPTSCSGSSSRRRCACTRTPT